MTVIDVLLMVEKSIRGGKCHSNYEYARANNKYLKNFYKNKESSYIQYGHLSNLYGWTLSQNFSVNNFEWMKNTFQFNGDFIKNYNKESDEGYFLEADVQYIKKLHECHYDKSKTL